MNYSDVIEHFGGVQSLADALGIKKQAIYQWGGVIPRARQFEIESITGGKFKAQAAA